MVQDKLSASCVFVDQLGVWEVNGEGLFDEQLGVWEVNGEGLFDEQLGVWEVNGEGLFDEQCGVVGGLAYYTGFFPHYQMTVVAGTLQ